MNAAQAWPGNLIVKTSSKPPHGPPSGESVRKIISASNLYLAGRLVMRVGQSAGVLRERTYKGYPTRRVAGATPPPLPLSASVPPTAATLQVPSLSLPSHSRPCLSSAFSSGDG
ncbi:hypothetical protein OTU49_003450 [Cherax quadricarinatus]|uniref:Uncharacterized protein n=1 Tax=Cherax quadricarinatus TaxID=27406 RepID=A0AAW0X567_CHEQU